MEKLELYEIDEKYISYLADFEKHLFKNKKALQKFGRKYVGIVLNINDFDFFAPLSSFKEKHRKLSETIDFIKIGTYSVINLNNMFPAIKSTYTKVNIANLQDVHYKSLVRAEYRIIRQKTKLILQNAKRVYDCKVNNTGKLKLRIRCNDFKFLEQKCAEYKIR